MFYATITGTGGHGASPHQGTDPIFMLAQLINAIHGIRARRISPIRPAVISIGAVHAGDATNVIPSEVKLNGTIRSYDTDTRKLIQEELHRAFGVVKALGGDYDLNIVDGYDATYNDPEVATLIEAVATDMLGQDRIHPPEPTMGGEDFGYMTRLAPGVMFNLGAKYDDQHRAHHTPIFDIDESAFPIGAAMLAETAIQLMKQKAD